MWKVLLVVSAVVLAGSGYLSWENMNEKRAKDVELASTQKTLEDRLASLEATNAEIAQLESSIQMLSDETEALETEKIDLDAKVVEAESSLRAQESKLQADEERLGKAKAMVGSIAQIEALQREMVQLRAQIEETEIEVTQLGGAVASVQVEKDRLEKVAAEMVALRSDQEAGIIRGPFESTIREAYDQWGFVVVNGGYDAGVVNRAQLNVYRRGQPICKLLVTSVEAGKSAADIIPGSLAPGQRVRAGDNVIKAVTAKTPVVIPAGDEDDASNAAQPPADPFGGGAMDSGSAAPDPFGGGAMGSGGGAPDPFGGGGMMEDAEATPDPFQ
ncbi:MAG: hypothetical protein CMO61_04990 [Verrucomicrobiales bacterium]|jgi:hypothetical protein|nr:hypothetical protein [Verrucomicrobiales bacterium]HCQ79137.1 hypothetical protein [Verrucomicrobiales bacterium]|tara:strand:- start:4734 stop:5723 length:990 start_codon:yes stop_codon:yes gene_type:complete